MDLLLTDPPYGKLVTFKQTSWEGITGDGQRQGMRVARSAFNAARPLLAADAHLLCFCHWESWPDFYDAVSPLMPMKNALVWHKDRGGVGDCEMSYAPDYEVILYAAQGRRGLTGRRDGAVIRNFPPPHTSKRIHPTEKPVPLLRYLITRHCPPGGLVLDPFAGSGSTLAAALACGRRAIGVEIERGYCERVAERIEAQAAQGQFETEPLRATTGEQGALEVSA